MIEILYTGIVLILAFGFFVWFVKTFNNIEKHSSGWNQVAAMFGMLVILLIGVIFFWLLLIATPY